MYTAIKAYIAVFMDILVSAFTLLNPIKPYLSIYTFARYI